MKYIEKYDRYVDDDLVFYRWSKTLDKLVQVKLSKNLGGYLRLSTKVGSMRVHRVIWETFVGEIPEGYEIDHINTIRDDNRLENLRCVTPKENMSNPLTRKHCSNAQKGKKHSEETIRKNSDSHKGKPSSEFGAKFKEHFGQSRYENAKKFDKEYMWYRRHGKCRWE